MLRGASADALADLSEQLGTRTLADAATLVMELFGAARVLRAEPALRRVATRQRGRGRRQGVPRRRRLRLRARRQGPRRRQGRRPPALDRLARPRRRARAPRGARAGAVGRQGRRAGSPTSCSPSGRLVDDNPDLRIALSDPKRSLADRTGLLTGLLGEQTLPATTALVRAGGVRHRHHGRHVAARLPGHRGRGPRRDRGHGAHRARAEQRRPGTAGRARWASSTTPPSTSTSWSTPTSSAGCGSRSVTT